MPYKFIVNNRLCSTDEDKPLLRYLRDDLGLHSVKDGCSEGACGTCTVIVDGAAVKSCVMSTRKMDGRRVQTVEGLSAFEKEAFVYAFGVSGSVQCGFCTPGMVMAGKALIGKNPDPSEEEIRKAIRGNLCRCTGYRKVIDGIKLAAAILRGDAKIDPEAEKGDDYGVGQSAFRVDLRQKVLGYGKYPDDIEMEGMLHLSAVRSQYARARVLSIDAAAALALPGVVGVLTAADVPHNKVGHIQQDWDVMIAEGEITRCVGDAICLVVAETEEILEVAKKLIYVDYEVLKPVTSIAEAMAPDAPKVHSAGNLCQTRHVTRGDAAAALKSSAYTVTKSFSTPFTEHAFLEPECAVAFPYKDGVKILSADQGVYDTRREVAIMFGWEPERVVVENMLGVPFPPEEGALLAKACGAREGFGTDLYIYAPVFAARFGLQTRNTEDGKEALRFLQEGRGMVIANTYGDRPEHTGVFSDSGHYIVLASARGTEVQVWDPMYREGSGRYDVPGRKGKVRLDGVSAYADFSEIEQDCYQRPYFLFWKA